MVFGCLLGWQSVMYQFCDLDQISRIILSEACLIYYRREESKICCIDISLDADESHTILLTVILTFDLVSCLEHTLILFDVGITDFVC